MKMPNMMITTLLVIVVVAAIGFYTREQSGVPEGEVGLEISVPQRHVLLAGYDTIPLPIVLRLINRSDVDTNLRVDGSCKVFRYVVTDTNGEFVQAKRYAKTCTGDRITNVLAARAAHEEIQQIPLDAARYQPGDYKLRIKFWNYEGDAAFSLVAGN